MRASPHWLQDPLAPLAWRRPSLAAARRRCARLLFISFLPGLLCRATAAAVLPTRAPVDFVAALGGEAAEAGDPEARLAEAADDDPLDGDFQGWSQLTDEVSKDPKQKHARDAEKSMKHAKVQVPVYQDVIPLQFSGEEEETEEEVRGDLTHRNSLRKKQNSCERNKEEVEEKDWHVLFVVIGSSRDMTNHVRSTWANLVVGSGNVLFVEDGATDMVIETKDCQVDTPPAVMPEAEGWMRTIWQHAQALVMARSILQCPGSKLKWAFVIDDKAYVRPRELNDMLWRGNNSHFGRMPLVMGTVGCETDTCKAGICQPGGYAINEPSLSMLQAQGAQKFMDELLLESAKCGRWPTLGLTQMLIEKKIRRRALPGAYPWALSKQCFDKVLEQDRPMLFNGVSPRSFKFLLNLFGDDPSQDVYYDFANSPSAGPVPGQTSNACAEWRSCPLCVQPTEAKPWTNQPVKNCADQLGWG